MLQAFGRMNDRAALKRGRKTSLSFVAAVLLALAFACGGAQGVPSPSPTAEVAALTSTKTPTSAAAASRAATSTETLALTLEAAPEPTEEQPTSEPVVGPASCDELRQALQPAMGPTSEVVYCDDEKKVAVEYRSKSRTWAVHLLATPSIDDWRAKQKASLEVLKEVGAEPCSSFWMIVDVLKPELRPGDLDPYGCRESMATPTPTLTAAPVDARSVPVESLLRPGAKVKKVLYASLDETPPEEIVVYSEITILKDERECGPVPFLEVFAYDTERDQWGKVFDASDERGPLAGIRLEDYDQGPMCVYGYWIHPLDLMDFDGDGTHELLMRRLGGGGTGNFTEVTVYGFEGEAPEFTARKLFEARLSKLQAVVVASERELRLDQGLWLRGGGAQMPAMLRGVVRYDAASGTIAVVDEEARLLCMEGTVLDKAPDTLTIRCEADEPGVRQSVPPEFEGEERFPVDMQFIVDRFTQFEPKSSVNSLDDVHIGQSVRVWPATLGLQAVRGVTWGWRVEDGVWSAEGGSVSPVAGLVEVLSAP